MTLKRSSNTADISLTIKHTSIATYTKYFVASLRPRARVMPLEGALAIYHE